MTAKYMLINESGEVLAQLTSRGAINQISEISIINWRGDNYIYSRDHTNGEYQFFQKAGRRINLTDAAFKIWEG